MNLEELENLTKEIFKTAARFALKAVDEDPDIDRPKAFGNALAKAIREIDHQNIIFKVEKIDSSISIE